MLGVLDAHGSGALMSGGSQPGAGGVQGCPIPHPPWLSNSPMAQCLLPSLCAAMAGAQGCSEGQIAGLYDLGRTLGTGHFAVVKAARHVFTGQRVAVKVIDKSKLAGGAAGQLLQEVRCMKLVQHPNVVRLYEVIDTHAKLYLILELGDGGDMFDHIMRHEGGLPEARAKHYFAQIVHAISYCHKLHVVHRDLKPENVVFFQEQDIWSLGVILYMLVCGHPPFQEANDSETLTMIMDCRYTVPAHVSAQCADLISRMLQRDPKCRASLEQIEGHPWLQGVDPSPASRCLLPLTSHKRVSQEEHEIILRAMMCGNIADRDTIQEALEANRYNHITATYFLLAERMLREKQEKQSRSLSLVYDLAREVQSRGNLPGTFSPMGSSSSLLAFTEVPHGLTAVSPLPTGANIGSRQPPRTLLKIPAVDTTITKSTPALQQICEEEEEEDEEDEGRPSAMERKSSSLNQEQMRAFLCTHHPSSCGELWGPGAELGGWGWAGKAVRGGWDPPALWGDGAEPPKRKEDADPRGSSAEPPWERGATGSPQSSSAEVPQGLGAEVTHSALPSPTDKSEGQEAPGSLAERSVESSGLGSVEGGVENAIKLDPGKSKGGSLRDRLLQFPLCEKALAFRLQPGSRETLLSLGQFNCCHVI
ncbi:SNF-related serine/threonine-protein kinase-like isoform X2 [Neopsephotus bourkii]|uniref:SNF-related serine/threonine-protein kinase-like isoform X2 n=1 Tax=Neopsephotus bourkii TaxID=309878 RepID=UPI002AA59BD7|nr:SNF-related serine/threonine-protein kinase-like isoform X2 [Neopsephotus bourkii]